jgi:hypothetical protein
LVPIGGTDIVTRLNPPNTRSGMVSLTLDRTGRLVTLLAVPAQTAMMQERSVASVQTSADWKPLFAEAGLTIAQFSPAHPQWMPPIFADGRAAWQGTYPDRRDVPIRIEAAAVLGKPVYFEIVAPWTLPTNEDRGVGQTSGERVGLLMRTAVAPLVFAIAVLLALRNLRLGRGDRRGALRVEGFRAMNPARGEPPFLIPLAKYFSMRVGFTAADFEAARRSMSCHRTQYSDDVVERVTEAQRTVMNGTLLLVPFLTTGGGTDLFEPR